MFKPVFISFTVAYFLFCDVQAQDGMKELEKEYLSHIMDCTLENPVTPEDFDALKDHKMPDKENVRCLFACAYKKIGLMTEKGELNVQKVQELSKKYLSSDAEKIKLSEDFIKACAAVNDVAVSDGSKGCERAALIFICGVEKTPKFFQNVKEGKRDEKKCTKNGSLKFDLVV